MSLPRVWGATADEVAAAYPCDALAEPPYEAWFRAVSVRAGSEVVFRRLCQLKVAPYSYDLLDNLGRRSPRELTPGVEVLARGQRVMTIFELVDFALNEHLTIRMSTPRARRLFGDFVISYVVRPGDAGEARLTSKLAVAMRAGLSESIRRYMLAWGDLVMMHRQLVVLRGLAERDQASG